MKKLYVHTYSVVRAVCQDLPGSTTGEIEARSLLFVNMMLLVRDKPKLPATSYLRSTESLVDIGKQTEDLDPE